MYRNFFKEYFSFSIAARRGIWILITIIIIAFSIPYLYSLLFKDNFKSPKHEEIEEFDKAFIEIKGKEKTITPLYIKLFDPNKISKEDWIKIGVKSKIAANIEKYLEKGGHFYRKEDLLKIYGFDKKTCTKLSPYFVFPADTTILMSKRFKKNLNIEKKSINKIELNTADSSALEKLPNINKTLSERILKYKVLLGGFFKREQLMEVYGLKKNIYDSIKNMVKVDSNLITKININIASEKQLSKHPYIGKYKAKEIIKYKKFKTKISDYNELLLNGFFSNEEINKLRHYLKFE